MVMRRTLVLALVSLAWGLSACAPVGGYRNTESSANPESLAPIVVRASGFGTYENVSTDRLDPRLRLLARRASRLDAYRNLAERVYGTVVYGGATVNDFVLRNDLFRVYVDSYIRGAKVVAVNEHSDGVVETVMELKLEPRFHACVSGVDDDQVRALCPIPMPRGRDAGGDIESRSADSLYYLE